jgi:lipoteichoic acid synthase
VNVLGLGALLSRRDWVYAASLLVPFAAYNLVLKSYDAASLPGDGLGFSRALDLVLSDVFVNLGYSLLWIALLAAARGRGPLFPAVVVLFHAATMFIMIVNTCAHQYFQETGADLDYGTIVEWISRLDEVLLILTYDIPLSAWVVLAAALLYSAWGPRLVSRAVERRRGWTESSPVVAPRFSLLSSLGLFMLALGFGWLSLLVGHGSADAPLARDRFVNVVLTGVREATVEEDDPNPGSVKKRPAAHATLAPSSRTQKRNVVLVHLESTRAQSVTPYNEDLKTTPFLDKLAESSLLVERAYTTVPRSSKASVAVNCGIEPAPYPGPEFEPDGVPARCLPGLLKEQGYDTVFFQSTSNSIDNFGDVVRGFGYEEFYPSEVMDTEGFQVTNTFGYEDDVMLGPSEEWLTAQKQSGSPFLAEYLTGTGHHDYQCLDTRYGSEAFAEDGMLNRYLNCLRLQDFFLENLIEQYKELGLYEDTIFVIFGDHGEGFKEHGREMHGDTIYEEGLRVPLLIHAPGWFEDGRRVEGLSSQIDVLPTVLEMLGYGVKNGRYPGYSLLRTPPEERTLFFSCISGNRCLAGIKGSEKYIYHYGDQPEEVFDLAQDPLEKRNLAGERDREELDERREELFAWYTRVNAEYGDVLINGTVHSESSF